MNDISRWAPGLNRASARQLHIVRTMRVCVLTTGVLLGVALEVVARIQLLDARLVLGATLCALGTLATFAPVFLVAPRHLMVGVALIDLLTLTIVFDAGVGLTLTEALIAGPAMWLAVALGRRGVALAALTCTALFVAPGLLLTGVPVGGWHHATIVVAFAFVASAGIAVSVEMWDAQLGLLEAQATELKDALEVKDDFVALVSHELRTPLTSIIGYLDLALDDADGLPDPIGSHLRAVSRNADRLLLLVTDLLAAEAAERAPMPLASTPTDLSSLAQLSLDDVALRAETAQVEIASYIEPDITIEADGTRILQALDNLLSNAVKYTPPTGLVRLTLRRHSVTDVLLEVTDTGIGIAPEDQAALFTKFFRARNATDLAIPGIGLGLMITRKIIEAHGGSISVHSQEGVGTSMRVLLPLTQVVAAADAVTHDLSPRDSPAVR